MVSCCFGRWGKAGAGDEIEGSKVFLVGGGDSLWLVVVGALGWFL